MRWEGSALKDCHPLPFLFTMTQDLALSLLRRGANGAQILEILESIALRGGDAPQPTLEEVQF